MTRARVVVIVAMLLAGCRVESHRNLRQPIEMGPFTFMVERAYEDASASDDRCSTIVVAVRLHASERAKVHFDDFLNDNTSPKMILHPAAELVDREGHRYLGWARRVNGREDWQVSFPLSYEETPLSSATCAATRSPADFLLTINNPDARHGQPSRVSVALG